MHAPQTRGNTVHIHIHILRLSEEEILQKKLNDGLESWNTILTDGEEGHRGGDHHEGGEHEGEHHVDATGTGSMRFSTGTGSVRFYTLSWDIWKLPFLATSISEGSLASSGFYPQ